MWSVGSKRYTRSKCNQGESGEGTRYGRKVTELQGRRSEVQASGGKSEGEWQLYSVLKDGCCAFCVSAAKGGTTGWLKRTKVGCTRTAARRENEEQVSARQKRHLTDAQVKAKRPDPTRSSKLLYFDD